MSPADKTRRLSDPTVDLCVVLFAADAAYGLFVLELYHAFGWCFVVLGPHRVQRSSDADHAIELDMYCCKPRTSSSARAEIERGIRGAVPRRQETRLSTHLLSFYIAPHLGNDVLYTICSPRACKWWN